MREKKEKPDPIKEILSPNLVDFYTLVVQAHKKGGAAPLMEVEFGESGIIRRLVFNDIPRSVMTEIFSEIRKRSDSFSCDIVFDSRAKKEDPDFIFSVRASESEKTSWDDLV